MVKDTSLGITISIIVVLCTLARKLSSFEYHVGTKKVAAVIHHSPKTPPSSTGIKP